VTDETLAMLLLQPAAAERPTKVNPIRSPPGANQTLGLEGEV